MVSFIAWVTNRSRAILIAAAVLTSLALVLALRIRIESSLENIMASDSPDVHFYDGVRATFGSDEIGVVGIRSDDLLGKVTLEKIRRITTALENIDGVERVVSLTNAVNPSRDAFSPPPLILRIPPSAGERAELVEQLQGTPLFAINLVSPDLRGSAINVFFDNLSDAEYSDLRIDEKILAILDEERGPEDLFYTGTAHIKEEATASMRRDLYLFTPIALALVLATLWFSFRRLRAVVAPMLTVVAALVWTLAAMVLAGKSINLGTFILPPLILVIGSSYAIHVLSCYYEQLDAGSVPDAATVRGALMRVWSPLLISAGTTIVGFAALGTNQITAIRELGIFAVAGVVFLALACLTLLPALLVAWPTSGRADAAPPAEALGIRKALGALGAGAYGSRGAVLAIAAAVGVATLLALAKIHIDSDFLGYFDPDSRVRRDNQAINDTIVGSSPFYIVVESDSEEPMAQWETLRRIRDLQSFLQTLPGVHGSISLVDYLELMERGTQSGEEDFTIDEDGNLVPFEAPEPFWQDPSSLQPLINLVRKNAPSFASVVTPDFKTGNVLVRTSLSGSRATEVVLERVREYVAANFPGHLRATPTGTLVLMTGTASEILLGQIRSLSLALLVIFAVMSLMFLSPWVGLLALLPNVLAIAVFYGLLGWFGIYLNLGTSLIATIALGIAVDSTIHFMTNFSRNARKDPDQRAALVATIQSVGVPIVFTTTALLLGFLVFAGSSFVPIRSFGYLTAFTLAAALLANLVVLPALLATTRIITLWDLVGVKLGEDPTNTIPLLAGLRPAQARVVVLMGKLQRYTGGEAIVRQGEHGHEMYVLLEGGAEVWAADGKKRHKIAEMGRGEAFGEMALVRQDERTADVIASGDVEALVIDEDFIERLRRRYPRIAAQVLVNMTRSLSDRLHAITQRYVGAQ